MKSHCFVLFLMGVLLWSCKKEEEPFEYPEDPEQQETIITHAERTMKGEQFNLWTIDQSMESCPTNGNDPAYYEYDSVQNEFVLHLVPLDSSCELSLEVATQFDAAEIASENWNNLNFEFFFSEYLANANTELWLSFYYKNVEVDLDLVSVINDIGVGNGNDGTFKVTSDTGGVYLSLNGQRLDAFFGSGSDNHFSTNGNGSDNHFSLHLEASGTDQQSLMLFKYMRVFTIGVKE